MTDGPLPHPLYGLCPAITAQLSLTAIVQISAVHYRIRAPSAVTDALAGIHYRHGRANGWRGERTDAREFWPGSSSQDCIRVPDCL